MATRFYLSSTAAIPITPVFTAGTDWGRVTEADRRFMSPFGDGSAKTAKTLGGGANIAANGTILARQYVSDPMAAGVAFSTSDTIKCVLRCNESAANDNINRSPIKVWVCSQDGTTERAVLKDLAHIGPNTTEWPTGQTRKQIADGDALTTGYTTVAGDRLVIELGAQVDGAGGTSVTGTINFGNDGTADMAESEGSDTGTNNPWFEVSRDIAWLEPYFAGTTSITGANATSVPATAKPPGAAIGNTLVAHLYIENNGGVTPTIVSTGDTWEAIHDTLNTTTSPDLQHWSWICKSVGNASSTITVTWGGGSFWRDFAVHLVKGADPTTPQDVAATENSGTSTSETGLGLASGTAQRLMMLLTGKFDNASIRTAWTSPLVARRNPADNLHMAAGHDVAGTDTGNKVATITSDSWVAHLIALKAPSAGATGTSALTMPFLALAATGTQEQSGSSALTLPAVALASTGVMQPEGTSALTLPAVALASTGTQRQSGTSALTLPSVSLAATGKQAQSGTSALTLPSVALASTGVMQPSGTSALILPSVALAATGEQTQSGSAALTLPSVELAATGTATAAGSSGTAALTLPFLALAASGEQTQSGTSSITLPAVALAASGEQTQSGTASLTLPTVALSATGTMQPSGAAALTLPSVALAGAGTQTQSGTSALTLPSVELASTGVMQPSGAASLTLPSVGAAATGTQTQSGSAALTLPFLAMASTGVMQPSGTSQLTIPTVALAATGFSVAGGVFTGSVALTLPMVALASSGTQTQSGSSALTLPAVALSATGEQTQTGTVAITLPAVALAGVGEQAQTGIAALILPAVALSGTGTTTLPSASGAASLTLPSVSLSASGYMQPTGTSALTLPFISVSGTGFSSALSLPATGYVSLHVGDPGLTGANEVVAEGYDRQFVTFETAGNQIRNPDNIDFSNMPAVTITHVGIWSAGGSFLQSISIESQTLESGDTYRIARQDLMSEAGILSARGDTTWRYRPGGSAIPPYTWALWEKYPPERWKYIGDGGRYWIAIGTT